jgi:sterol desaturase/sphingolipid hydroxylase (fatty acid hydroxylase superfamily)
MGYNGKTGYLSNEDISVPIFQNKWLDRLTRSHISVPVSLFFLYAIGLLHYTSVATDLSTAQVVGLFFGGTFFFTLVEYLVHRFAYHPGEHASEERQKFCYTVHGIHHDYPKDKRRLALPPAASVLVATLLLVIFRVILGNYAFAFLAGFLVGYALYLLVHYSVHIFRMPKNFLKILWVNHSIHHYSPEEVLFGVSSPLWDYVFGTVPKKQKRKRVEVKV